MQQIVLEHNGSDQQVIPATVLMAADLFDIVTRLAAEKEVPISEITLRFAETDIPDPSAAAPSLRSSATSGRQSTR